MSTQQELINASKLGAQKAAQKAEKDAWSDIDKKVYAVTGEQLLEIAKTGARNFVVEEDIQDTSFGGMSPSQYVKDRNARNDFKHGAKLYYKSFDCGEGYNPYWGDLEFRW